MIRFTAGSASLAVSPLEAGDAGRCVLTGDIVTMNMTRDVLAGGRLCLEGSTIVAVRRAGEALPTGFLHAPVVETGGTIYPGLFNIHNHLPYNMIPLWQVDRRFGNRTEWQNIPEYYPAVTAPFKLLNEQKTDPDFARAIVRYAECRELFGGATVVHGMSLTNKKLYEGLLRNIEHPMVADLPTVKSNTADFSAEKLADMLAWTKEGRPYIYHLSEGVGEYGEKWFRQLDDTPGALNRYLLCIHCVGIPASGWNAMKSVAGVVWSPTSNLLLYGETCAIEEAKSRGIPIAIGADWSPSGCKNLLGELKVAREVSRKKEGVLTDEDLVAAVTCVPAAMVGWSSRLGSLEPGKWADLLVLDGAGGDAYARLVSAKETEIRAVVIDGRVRLGHDDGFVEADPSSSERIIIGGKTYVLDLAEPVAGSLDGMKLSDAVAKLQDGLARLPEFESKAKQLTALGVQTMEEGWQIEDEMNPEPLHRLLAKGETLPAKPMKLAPITAVDDPQFKVAMQASVNMPEYAKRAFDD